MPADNIHAHPRIFIPGIDITQQGRSRAVEATRITPMPASLLHLAPAPRADGARRPSGRGGREGGRSRRRVYGFRRVGGAVVTAHAVCGLRVRWINAACHNANAQSRILYQEGRPMVLSWLYVLSFHRHQRLASIQPRCTNRVFQLSKL